MNHYETMSYIDKKREFEAELPKDLDPKLKEAYLSVSMIGAPFYWKKIKGGSLQLGGFPFKSDPKKKCTLIVMDASAVWNVIHETEFEKKNIFSCLEFAEAFRAAREFAFDNRREFMFSDRKAPFKAKPISEKQLALITASGYTLGVKDLTSGQAGAIMDSGILRKKKQEPEVEHDFQF